MIIYSKLLDRYAIGERGKDSEQGEVKLTESERKCLDLTAIAGADMKDLLQGLVDAKDVVLWMTLIGDVKIFDARIEKADFWNEGDECTEVHRGYKSIALEIY